jgi:hypothetical protein
VFDTLAYTQKLRAGGVPPDQAEAHAEALKAALAETVATKGDLQAVETTLKSDLKDAETALRADLTAVETALRADLTAVETALKSDLKDAETALRADLTALRADMTVDITAVKADLGLVEQRMLGAISEAKNSTNRWLIGVLAAIIVASLSILVKLFRP